MCTFSQEDEALLVDWRQSCEVAQRFNRRWREQQFDGVQGNEATGVTPHCRTALGKLSEIEPADRYVVPNSLDGNLPYTFGSLDSTNPQRSLLLAKALSGGPIPDQTASSVKLPCSSRI